MAAVIATIISVWFFGSLLITVGLCRAAANSDQKQEHHHLAVVQE